MIVILITGLPNQVKATTHLMRESPSVIWQAATLIRQASREKLILELCYGSHCMPPQPQYAFI